MHGHAPARSLYIHVPFCQFRCGYCNFTLAAGRDDWMADYLRALRLEIDLLPRPEALETLYFGGGTPSYLPAPRLAELIELTTTAFPLAEDAEVTLEANPNDLTPTRCRVLADSPVNRLSLGVQSFDGGKRQSLERHHSSEQVDEALARSLDLTPNVSLDLMFAAPYDAERLWRSDLRAAIHCNVPHVSTYELTIEKGTRFWNRRQHGDLQDAPEAQRLSMYETAIELLGAAGLEQYEISSFARPGFRSRHNQVYWRGEPYLALGPGAASYVGGVRRVNHRSVRTYLRRVLSGASGVAETEVLSAREAARDRLVFGLRMLEGVDEQAFERQAGMAMEAVVAPRRLESLLQQGLLKRAAGRLRLTRRGILLADSVAVELLRD